jgi:metal-responsive CopG/Arc/MetJ family transcriptional regulator
VFIVGRKILNISLPKELYDAVENLAQIENKSKAEITREIIREYMTKRERWLILRQWGAETINKLGLIDEADVDKLIHQYRSGN